MRLAFVSIHDPEDPKQWSGIPFFILGELRGRGIDVEVIAPNRSQLRYRFIPQRILSKVTGASLQVDRRPLALNHYAAQISQRLKVGKFDAVFSPSSIPIARLDAKIPVLYWTDAVIEGMLGYYSGSFLRMTARELKIAHDQEQSALDHAAYAVFASTWAAETVKSLYQAPPDKVRVIEFGANLSVEHDAAQIVRWNEKRLAQDCVLLFIGVDWSRKGGALAFEATRLLNERGIKAVLKVVGCDAPDAPFVERLGFISKGTADGQRRIEQLLATSTFFVMPTRAEAAGIVFCESAAFGLPVVTTRTGGVESYVKDGQTGFCLPMTATGSAYADVIQETLDDPNSYRRLSLAGFERYKQTLNWSAGVSNLLNLIEQAITR
jgi:glycosyltransferase involved in cell wall biosynthesis